MTKRTMTPIPARRQNRAVQKAEAAATVPEGGWPVMRLDTCGCRPIMKDLCGPTPHDSTEDMAHCLWDRFTDEWWRPEFALVEGVGAFAFVHNLSGFPEVYLHETLHEVQSRQMRFHLDTDAPDVRHALYELVLTRLGDDDDVRACVDEF
jgi:hypothetical protein